MSKLSSKISYFKRGMRLIVEWPIYKVHSKYKTRFNILSKEESIQKIIKTKGSLVRFGDGEFNWIQGISYKSNFQSLNPKMALRLKQVLNSNVENLFIAVPGTLENVDNLQLEAKSFWVDYNLRRKNKIIKLFDRNNLNKTYLDTMLSRFYMDTLDLRQANKIISLLKNIWNDRQVIIVEGRETRFGVGNDFLSNAKDVSRILGPVTDAFEQYDELFTIVKNKVKNVEDPLVLIALGPTATILAHDLAVDGIQSVDIGHADIEYEWFLKKAKIKIPISGKYVNETPEKFKKSALIEGNSQYQSEIIGEI